MKGHFIHQKEQSQKGGGSRFLRLGPKFSCFFLFEPSPYDVDDITDVPDNVPDVPITFPQEEVEDPGAGAEIPEPYDRG